MKKTGFYAAVTVVVLIGLFMWALSGASDSKAPTDVRTIDVSAQL